MKKITLILLLQLVVAFCIPSVSESAADGRHTRTEAEVSPKDSRISRILPILESRFGDPKLRRKATIKLETMPDDRVELISSLCDKIAMNSASAGSDIAFSLISMLIILS